MDFKDLTSEKYREYEFPGGHVVRIENPTQLNVSASGGHRVADAQGVSHYIPAGWIHLSWVVHEGQAAFDF